MKIYTKTGDNGETSLVGGKRIAKDHIKIDAYGTVDELNAWIGVLHDKVEEEKVKHQLNRVQNQLFVLGSHLASEPGKKSSFIPEIDKTLIKDLETWMDEMSAQCPELKNFILPSGSELISFCHVARAVCRRAERVIIALARVENVENDIIIIFNRLSDYLFVLARFMSVLQNVKEIIWKI